MTNRIDHTGHGHPATPKARAECRKVSAPVMVEVHLDDAGWVLAEYHRTEGTRRVCRTVRGNLWVRVFEDQIRLIG